MDTLIESNIVSNAVNYLNFDGQSTAASCSKSSNQQVSYRDANGGYNVCKNDLVDICNAGFTIEATIKMESLQRMPIISVIYTAKPQQATSDLILSFEICQGRLGLQLNAPTSWNSGIPGKIALTQEYSAGLVPFGEWCRVAMIWKYGGSAEFYINGKLVMKVSHNTFIPSSYRFAFGNYQSDFFNGAMRDVCIWKGPRPSNKLGFGNKERLSALQITQLEEEGLGGYWPMDETSGTTIHDLTSIANHALVKNGEWGIQHEKRNITPLAHKGQPWDNYFTELGNRANGGELTVESLDAFTMKDSKKLAQKYMLGRMQKCSQYPHLFSSKNMVFNPFDNHQYSYVPAPPKLFPGYDPDERNTHLMADDPGSSRILPEKIRGNPDYLTNDDYAELGKLILGAQLSKNNNLAISNFPLGYMEGQIEPDIKAKFQERSTRKTAASLFKDAYISNNPTMLPYMKAGDEWVEKYGNHILKYDRINVLKSKLSADQPDVNELSEVMTKLSILGRSGKGRTKVDLLYAHLITRLVFDGKLTLLNNDSNKATLAKILDAMSSDQNADEVSRKDTKDTIEAAKNSLDLAAKILEIMMSPTTQSLENGYQQIEATSTETWTSLNGTVTPGRLAVIRGAVGALAFAALLYDDPKNLSEAKQVEWGLTFIHVALSIGELVWDNSSTARDLGSRIANSIAETISPTASSAIMEGNFGSLARTTFGENLGEFLGKRLGPVLLIYGAAMSFSDYKDDIEKDKGDAIFDAVLGFGQLAEFITVLGQSEVVLGMLGITSVETLGTITGALGPIGVAIGIIVIITAISKWIYDSWYSEGAKQRKELERLVSDLQQDGYGRPPMGPGPVILPH